MCRRARGDRRVVQGDPAPCREVDGHVGLAGGTRACASNWPGSDFDVEAENAIVPVVSEGSPSHSTFVEASEETSERG